jgi:hypothetical protein
MTKRNFTVEEAEALLPTVENKLNELKFYKDAIVTLSSLCIYSQDEHENVLNLIRSRREHHKLLHRFFNTLEELHSLGLILRDLDTGVVDFYALHKNKEIFLCWQTGEMQISYWHEINEGYTNRHPIDWIKTPEMEE